MPVGWPPRRPRTRGAPRDAPLTDRRHALAPTRAWKTKLAARTDATPASPPRARRLRMDHHPRDSPRRRATLKSSSVRLPAQFCGPRTAPAGSASSRQKLLSDNIRSAARKMQLARSAEIGCLSVFFLFLFVRIVAMRIRDNVRNAQFLELVCDHCDPRSLVEAFTVYCKR
jgi:hypothetical protein